MAALKQVHGFLIKIWDKTLPSKVTTSGIARYGNIILHGAVLALWLITYNNRLY